jgi:hypothetical protein
MDDTDCKNGDGDTDWSNDQVSSPQFAHARMADRFSLHCTDQSLIQPNAVSQSGPITSSAPHVSVVPVSVDTLDRFMFDSVIFDFLDLFSSGGWTRMS